MEHFKTDKITFFEDRMLQFQIFMSPDTYEYHRQIYTIWELFGDIGGLLEVVMIIGGFSKACVALIFGSGLDNYLMSRLFYVETLKKKGL